MKPVNRERQASSITVVVPRNPSSDAVRGFENFVRELQFRSPKPQEDVYLAAPPSTCRPKVVLKGVECLRLSETLSEMRNMVVGLARPQAKVLMALDDATIDKTANGIDSGWFDGGVNVSLLQEYYRPVVVADAHKDLVAKLLLSRQSRFDLLTEPLKSRARIDVVLQVAGIQFRKQHFALVWKLCDAISYGENEDTEIDDTDRERNKRRQRHSIVGGYAFQEVEDNDAAPSEEEEEEESEEGEEEDVALPTWDEYDAMRGDAVSKLWSRYGSVAKEAEELKQLAEVLETSDKREIGVLERALSVLESDGSI